MASLDSSSHHVYNKNGKFIGGAHASRKKAAKRGRGTPILNPIERQRDAEFLSLSMHPTHRFFAALFRSLPHKFFDSYHTAKGRKIVMGEIVQRVRLPLPRRVEALSDASEHLRRLASLVLEESRHAVAEALYNRWNHSRVPTNGLELILSSQTTVTRFNHQVVFFHKATPFTPRESYDMRNGTVFEIIRSTPQSELNMIILGTVVSYAERKGGLDADDHVNQHDQTVALMIFRNIKLTEGASYRIYPLTSMISQARQFEACTRTLSLPFLPALMGHKMPVHTRFANSDDDVIEIDDSPSSDSSNIDDDDSCSSSNDSYSSQDTTAVKKEMGKALHEEHDKVSSKALEIKRDNEEHKSDEPCRIPRELEPAGRQQFQIPKLNATQERASQAFLDSWSGSITLVQGPPGTGKSTLISATICRYLLEDKAFAGARRRLMVCAPTNKAVTVLASRHLQVARGNSLFNIVMIGDKKKLLMEDPPGLRGIFVYTWMDVMCEQWMDISRSAGTSDTDELLTRASLLTTKLESQLPENCAYMDLSTLVDEVTSSLVELFSCGLSAERTSLTSPIQGTIRKTISNLITRLRSISEEDIAQELLSTAHVIFCTLTSAGSSVVKRTESIHDLIVDEAAAATEPELYIPFHLKPQRLMAVGDPKQLPATVMSRFAEKLGLNKSLHERLMFDSKQPNIMLDVQYRMKPDICSFPSTTFYGDCIMNGSNVTGHSYGSPVALMDSQPYTFIPVDGEEQRHVSGSYHNQKEAWKVVELLGALKIKANKHGDGADPRWYSIDRVRVITFYQAQVNLIQRLLRKKGLGQVMVSTVDSSQGCEADVVIISFVRCGKLAAADADVRRTVGFLTDDRRLNVALTRAKYQLVCVGNVSGLERVEGADTIQALIKDARAKNFISDFRQRYKDSNSTINDDNMSTSGAPRNGSNGKSKNQHAGRQKRSRAKDSKKRARRKKPKNNDSK